MIWFYYILIFIISSLILVQSSRWIVRSLIRISHFLKWREFIVTAVLMAFATSLPEAFIGVTSALRGVSSLSFGTIIGSNIIALTIVVGIAAFLSKGLKLPGAVLQRAAFDASIITLLPLLLILDRELSRIDGVILLLVLLFYFRQLLSQEERFTKVVVNSIFKRNDDKTKLFLRNLGIFVIGVSLLLASAEGIVFSATKLAEFLDVFLVSVGIIIVALGTSLPEIIFGFKSITMGREEMILGNVIGSVVINSTFILGVVALVSPFNVITLYPYVTGIIFTTITALFFMIFSRTHEAISTKEAFFLLIIYILFFWFQIRFAV
jgi:cation:H+ antiporter